MALDVVGTVLMGYDPKAVHYLELATRMGLGWDDPARISVVGPSVETIRDELRSRYGARRKWPFPSNYGTVNRSRLAADLTPPAICRIRKPLQGQVLEPGVVTIEVEARDGEELAKTEVFVEGELLELFPLDGQERKLLASWDASAASRGPYRIRAVTYDRNFNETKSEVVTVRFGPPTLVRGEIDGASGINISDVIFLLGYLFLGNSEPACLDATDVDDDGVVDLTDPIRLLGYLFLGSQPPPPPFPTCEEDPTDDALGCAASVCDF